MTISEHLIENAIERLEMGYDYDDFMASKLLKEQAKQVGISMTDLWYMAQYIYYTYIPIIEGQIKEEMVKKYGFDIDEVDNE